MANPWEMDWSGGQTAAPVAAPSPVVQSSGAPWDREWGGGTKPKATKSFTEKLGETTLGHIAKSVYSAVTLPGDVMAGRAHVPGSADAQSIPGAVPYGSADSAGERIADLASVAVPSSVAAGTGKAIVGAYDAAKEAVAPSVGALKAAAKAGYEAPEVTGLTIASPAVTNFAETAGLALDKVGVSDVLAPKTFALLQRLSKAPDGSVITGQNLQSIRRAFGNAAASPDATERMAATSVIKQLDDLLPSLSKTDIIAGDAGAAAKTLGDARGNYAAAKRAEAIDDKVWQAELRSASANSGQNLSNTLRQRMSDVLLRRGESRGYSTEELAQMERIARGSKLENAVRFAGNAMGGNGGLVSAITGLATAGIAPAAGYGLKQLSNSMSMRQISKLSEMIRSNAPLAKSLEKFGEKAEAFAVDKSPRARADAVIAARNLSSNLKANGLVVTGKGIFDDVAD